MFCCKVISREVQTLSDILAKYIYEENAAVKVGNLLTSSSVCRAPITTSHVTRSLLVIQARSEIVPCAPVKDRGKRCAPMGIVATGPPRSSSIRACNRPLVPRLLVDGCKCRHLLSAQSEVEEGQILSEVSAAPRLDWCAETRERGKRPREVTSGK